MIVAAAVSGAARLGADPQVLAEARLEGRPLNRSLQIVQWSLAVTGRSSFPRHFAPGDHLVGPASRSSAALLLRELRNPPIEVERQLIGIDDAAGLDQTLRAIEGDLRSEIYSAATRPKRGDGLQHDLQLLLIGEVGAALAAVGIRPFLMSGTLLGFVREGRFMAHDYDIDLGLLPGADVDAARTAIDGLPSFSVEVGGPRVVAQHESGARIDVFPHELRDGLFWHGTKIHEWWNTPFELVAQHIEGIQVWTPDDHQRYLDENYGRWTQPVPFYDISFDTPNRRYRQNLDAARFLHSRCVQAIAMGDRWLLESAARELRDQFEIDVTDLLAPSRLVESHDIPGR